MGMRLGSGVLGCRASVEDCGAVGRQDPIRVWRALGYKKDGDFEGFSRGRWELWVVRETGWAWFAQSSCHWASPLAPRSYLKLK